MTDYGPLLRAVRSGDPAAIEELLMRAQQAAYRFSRLICGASASDAEDAMQEALLNVYRRAGDVREPKAFRAWLYRTVKNACLIGRRKRVHEPGRLLSLEELMPADDLPLSSPDRSPEQLAVDARTRARLRRALAQLPPSFRVVVFLRDIEGLSTREVAEVVGISEDNVKTRLHRARLRALRRLLGEPAADDRSLPRGGRPADDRARDRESARQRPRAPVTDDQKHHQIHEAGAHPALTGSPRRERLYRNPHAPW